jgi:DNA-directed RNA polymerase specialized sigma24 family protein
MRSLARSLVRDDAQADDLVQDAMVLALSSPPRDRQALPVWLATVVRNGARQLWRGESRRFVREEASSRRLTAQVAALTKQLEASRDGTTAQTPSERTRQAAAHTLALVLQLVADLEVDGDQLEAAIEWEDVILPTPRAR